MKSKIPPEWKIRLHKQGTEDQREMTGSSEESDGEHEFEFSPNQLLHLHQTLPISPKAAQKLNFPTNPKPDTVEPKIHSVPKDIVNESDSDHTTNQQDQYVDFNVSELNESKDASVQGAQHDDSTNMKEASPDQLSPQSLMSSRELLFQKIHGH